MVPITKVSLVSVSFFTPLKYHAYELIASEVALLHVNVTASLFSTGDGFDVPILGWSLSIK